MLTNIVKTSVIHAYEQTIDNQDYVVIVTTGGMIVLAEKSPSSTMCIYGFSPSMTRINSGKDVENQHGKLLYLG